MVSTAGIIIIGDEILSGRTKDTNVNWIANQLNLIGVRLQEVKVIQDDKKKIIDTVLEYSNKFTFVFTSGGIGPTHDDITTASIAEAFGKDLEKNKIAMRLLINHYKNSNIEFNEARQKMAIIPKGSVLIDNPVSVAPGFKINNVYVFAGVPRIMQGMFHSIKNELTGGVILKSKTITCDVGEGLLANYLNSFENEFKDVKIGSYPFFNPTGFGTSIVIRSQDINKINLVTERLSSIISSLGGKFELKD